MLNSVIFLTHNQCTNRVDCVVVVVATKSPAVV